MKKLLFLIMALVLVVGLAIPALAADYNSPSDVTTKGENTLAWTGQGATNGELNTVICDPTNYPDGYLHWVFTYDNDVVQATTGVTPQLTLGGSGAGIYNWTKHAGHMFHFYTPYYTPDSILTAVVSFNTTDETGNGKYNLVISHGCSGDGGGTKGLICVQKFYDADGNGTWDQGEQELYEWPVYIYDEAGALVDTLYTPDCIALEPGTYTLEEDMPTGWGNTTPASVDVEVTTGSEETVWFGNIELGRICVDKFYDTNMNGQWDQGELELEEWEIDIYDDAGNFIDTLEAPECIWLYPGSYTAAEAIYVGWGNTTPAEVDVEVRTNSTDYINFGNIQLGRICVAKFYDADTDGQWDTSEVALCNWEVKIFDVAGALVDTLSTPECSGWLYPGDYTVTETIPAGWVNTTPASVLVEVSAAMVQGDKEYNIEFGNVCLGAGGGKTLGFWSNKNGQAVMNDGGTIVPELNMLSVLNLKNATGGNFDPGTYPVFRTWLLGANASNMAYMLSAQLAAMELNVEAGLVNGNSLVWTGTQFLTVNQLMALANTELGLHGYTLAGNPNRAYQEYLKNALDKANNNMNFVQGTPCSYICPTPAP